MQKDLIIKGANENNLKNVDLVIPRDKFVVLTGLSGSGKSSLAFDTIYAEGQRRYVETGCGIYRRTFACHINRPKDYKQESKIDGGNRNRDSRLSEIDVCPHRCSSLSCVRQRNNIPVR